MNRALRSTAIVVIAAKCVSIKGFALHIKVCAASSHYRNSVEILLSIFPRIQSSSDFLMIHIGIPLEILETGNVLPLEISTSSTVKIFPRSVPEMYVFS